MDSEKTEELRQRLDRIADLERKIAWRSLAEPLAEIALVTCLREIRKEIHTLLDCVKELRELGDRVANLETYVFRLGE